MRGKLRKTRVSIFSCFAGAFFVVACGVPDGAIRLCEPGTIPDRAAGECVPASAGNGGEGGAAGMSGGEGGGGGAAGTCDPGRFATDPKNCGACGHDCRGAACEGGACKPELLADRLVAPYGIVLTDTDILWASPAKDIEGNAAAGFLSLSRSASAGATPSPLFEGATQRAHGFARAPSGEFLWGDLDTGTVSKRATNQAQPTAIATGRPDVTHVVVAGSHIYWSQGALATARAEDGVYRAPIAGGALETLAAMQSGPGALAVDGEDIYWVNLGPDGQIMHAKAGAAPDLIERVSDPIAIAAGGGQVAWAERASGRVAMRAKGATATATLVRDSNELVEGIALAGAFLYRIVFRPADKQWLIKRSTLDGAGEAVLTRITPVDAGYASNPLGDFRLAFDNDYIYIADPGALTLGEGGVPLSQKNGRLYRTAR